MWLCTNQNVFMTILYHFLPSPLWFPLIPCQLNKKIQETENMFLAETVMLFVLMRDFGLYIISTERNTKSGRKKINIQCMYCKVFTLRHAIFELIIEMNMTQCYSILEWVLFSGVCVLHFQTHFVYSPDTTHKCNNYE